MSIKIEEICNFSDFLKLKNEWNTLHTRSMQSDNILLTHEWFESWWQGFGENKTLFILLLYEHEELIAIAPLMKLKRTYWGLPIRVISLITNEHTNRADFIIIQKDFDIISAIMTYLNQIRDGWDCIEIDFLLSTSPTVKILRELSSKLGFTYVLKPSYRSPYIPINGNWNDFYTGRKGHFRRNLKNREKRLSKLGTVTLEQYSGNSSLDLFLEEMFQVGARSWKEGKGSAIASTQQNKTFYKSLALNASKKDRLSLHLLRLNDKAIAFHFSLIFCNRLLLLKTEYDIEFRTYSPGHIIQKGVLRHCFSEKLKEFDFLGESMIWKHDWTDFEKVHNQVLIFNNVGRSKIFSQIEVHAKPFLKHLPLVNKIHQKLQTSK